MGESYHVPWTLNAAALIGEAGIVANIIERSYGRVLGVTLGTVNPFIKTVKKRNECKVHKFINQQALNILGNDGNIDTWELFTKHIKDLNLGVVWADQDLRNRNHFYNPYTERGLYGFSNAMRECTVYYRAALMWRHRKDYRRALICLGVACHLIQDMTVPQHVNVTLFDNHRKFEKWVVETHDNETDFRCSRDGIYLNTVKDYIEKNAYAALDAYRESTGIGDLECRFFNIAVKELCLAQRSTAGLLQLFCRDVYYEDKQEAVCLE